MGETEGAEGVRGRQAAAGGGSGRSFGCASVALAPPASPHLLMLRTRSAAAGCFMRSRKSLKDSPAAEANEREGRKEASGTAAVGGNRAAAAARRVGSSWLLRCGDRQQRHPGHCPHRRGWTAAAGGSQGHGARGSPSLGVPGAPGDASMVSGHASRGCTASDGTRGVAQACCGGDPPAPEHLLAAWCGPRSRAETGR